MKEITLEDVRDEIYAALAYSLGNNKLEVIEDFDRENQRTIIIKLSNGQILRLVIPHCEANL